MSAAAPESIKNERLTDVLKRLLLVAKGGGMTVREMVEVMRGRGLHMIILLLCLPFLSPVAIPGLSLPFGLAIVVCGFRIALGHQPWLPEFIMRRRVSYKALRRMVHVGRAIYLRVEKMVHPRWGFVFSGPGMTMATGSCVALAGFLLSLPIPPPFLFTNTIPGFAVMFLSLGLIERDGRLIVIGYGLTALATAYFLLIALAGTAGVTSLWEFLAGG